MAGNRSCGDSVGVYRASICRTVHSAERRDRPVQGRNVQHGENQTRCVLWSWRHRDVARRHETGTDADERDGVGTATRARDNSARPGTGPAAGIHAITGSARRCATNRDGAMQ